VENDVNAGAGPVTHDGIGEVALEELHGLKVREIGALAGDKAVNASHRFATLQERGRNGAANEPSNAGD
jgi:hypothetical protein